MQLRPRKRFGQHFLHDRTIIARIVDAINPRPGETLVEIGPGQGALTAPLLLCADKLHVIEIDRDLAATIADSCNGSGKLVVHCLDALKFNFAGLGKQLRIVGNLPYNISTPLIFHCLEQLDHIMDMVFMLQEEVVDRIIAEPGGKDYGRLSVMVQARCQAQKLFRVAPGAFHPPPQVSSAIVRLSPHTEPLITPAQLPALELIVRGCFNQRRKTLRNCLKKWLSAGEIESLGLDPTLRPEQLTVNEFIRITTFYQSRSRNN